MFASVSEPPHEVNIIHRVAFDVMRTLALADGMDKELENLAKFMHEHDRYPPFTISSGVDVAIEALRKRNADERLIKVTHNADFYALARSRQWNVLVFDDNPRAKEKAAWHIDPNDRKLRAFLHDRVYESFAPPRL